MNVSDFLQKFTIKPLEDIEPHFNLTKIVRIDAEKHKGCFNCDDTCNQIKMKSEAWTSVQYCWRCNHLNVAYHQDRMSGVKTDVIKCYTDNDA